MTDLNKLKVADPRCPYCDTTESLRVACDGGGFFAPDYICEACYRPRDDGPCFDELPKEAAS